MLCPRCFGFGSVWLLRKFGKKRNKLEVSFSIFEYRENGNKLVAEKIWEKKEINLGFYALLGWWEKGKERKEIDVLEY